MAAFEDLWGLAVAGLALNVLVVVVVAALAAGVLVELRRTQAQNLERVAEYLPKVVPFIQASQVEMSVLIAVCEEKGTMVEQLAEFYDADGSRADVVRRHFGDTALVRRFLAWPHSRFLAEGYPAEAALADYLHKATPNADEDATSHTAEDNGHHGP